MIPKLLGTRDQFHRRYLFHGWWGERKEVQAKMPAIGSGCKYRRSLACLLATHLLLCKPVPNGIWTSTCPQPWPLRARLFNCSTIHGTEKCASCLKTCLLGMPPHTIPFSLASSASTLKLTFNIFSKSFELNVLHVTLSFKMIRFHSFS